MISRFVASSRLQKLTKQNCCTSKVFPLIDIAASLSSLLSRSAIRVFVRAIRVVNWSFSIKPSVKLSISLSSACCSLVLYDLRLSRFSDKVSVVLRSRND